MTNSWIRKGAPDTQVRERPVHRCGKCNNGTGVYNPECPNRPLYVEELPWVVPHVAA